MTVDALPAPALRALDANASKLVQLATGEYTALSVAGNLHEATKLGLVKAKDGNYVRPPIIPSPAYALARSASGVREAVTMLPLGGR